MQMPIADWCTNDEWDEAGQANWCVCQRLASVLPAASGGLRICRDATRRRVRGKDGWTASETGVTRLGRPALMAGAAWSLAQIARHKKWRMPREAVRTGRKQTECASSGSSVCALAAS